jgi:hypothetical protein
VTKLAQAVEVEPLEEELTEPQRLLPLLLQDLATEGYELNQVHEPRLFLEQKTSSVTIPLIAVAIVVERLKSHKFKVIQASVSEVARVPVNRIQKVEIEIPKVGKTNHVILIHDTATIALLNLVYTKSKKQVSSALVTHPPTRITNVENEIQKNQRTKKNQTHFWLQVALVTLILILLIVATLILNRLHHILVLPPCIF